MKNKEFEAKKQEIIEQVRQVHNEDSRFNSANFDKAALMISELQPPRPTCATCTHWGVTSTLSNGAGIWGCNNGVVAKKMYDCSDINSDFGCIHHSSYGEVK